MWQVSSASSLEIDGYADARHWETPSGRGQATVVGFVRKKTLEKHWKTCLLMFIFHSYVNNMHLIVVGEKIRDHWFLVVSIAIFLRNTGENLRKIGEAAYTKQNWEFVRTFWGKALDPVVDRHFPSVESDNGLPSACNGVGFGCETWCWTNYQV